jgi:hypothetical protein
MAKNVDGGFVSLWRRLDREDSVDVAIPTASNNVKDAMKYDREFDC